MVSWDTKGPEEPGVQNGTGKPGIAESTLVAGVVVHKCPGPVTAGTLVMHEGGVEA